MAALIAALAVVCAIAALLTRLLMLADRQVRSQAIRCRHQAGRIRALRDEARLLAEAVDRLTAQRDTAVAALTPDAERPASLAEWASALREIEALPTTDTPGDTR